MNTVSPGGSGLAPWPGPIQLSDTFVRQFSDMIQPRWENIQGTAGVVSLVGHAHAFADISGVVAYTQLPVLTGTWDAAPTITGAITAQAGLKVTGPVSIGTVSALHPLHVEDSNGNNYAAYIRNTAGTGVNFGLEVDGGTNSSDYSLHVRNAAGAASYLRVRGDGLVLVGSPGSATGANAGEILLGNSKSLKGTKADNSGVVGMVGLDSNSAVSIAEGGLIVTVAGLVTATDIIKAQKSTNAAFEGFTINNQNTGTQAYSAVRLQNNAGSSFIYYFGSGYTTVGLYRQNGLHIEATGAGGLVIAAKNASGDVIIATGATPTTRGTWTSGGLLTIGSPGSLANASAGNIVFATGKGLRSANAAGNDTLALIEAGASNQVALGSSGAVVTVGSPASITSALNGDVVLEKERFLRGANDAGSGTVGLVKASIQNTIQVVQLTSGLPVFIPNATAPGSNPSAGGFVYVESGALKYRGSSGTVTTLGNA